MTLGIEILIPPFEWVDDTDTKGKLAKMVSGEELETMLQEWDQPLVVDAYATWYVNQWYMLFVNFFMCTYVV